jgi:hypothetical protein
MHSNMVQVLLGRDCNPSNHANPYPACDRLGGLFAASSLPWSVSAANNANAAGLPGMSCSCSRGMSQLSAASPMLAWLFYIQYSGLKLKTDDAYLVGQAIAQVAFWQAS